MPTKMTTTKITYRKTNNLKKNKNNPKIHTTEQIQQIANSISEFGFTAPILIDENDNILAGHGRVEASILLEIDDVPCVILSGLTEDQKTAYIIIDNKLSLNTGFNNELLKINFDELMGNDFDLELTGFSENELLDLIDNDGSIDIEFNSDDSRGVTGNNLSFGKVKVPLSDEEFDNLNLLLEKYKDISGSLYGFANYLIDGRS